MRIRPYLAVLWIIVLLTLSLPSFAQDMIAGEIAPDETVGGSFTDSSFHLWQYQGQNGQIVKLTLARSSGQFTPELQMLSPSGSPLEPIQTDDLINEHGNNYHQVMIFDDLPENGIYEILVSVGQSHVQSALIANEYSLTATLIGQHRVEPDETIIPIPDVNLDSLFAGTPVFNEQLGINIFGEAIIKPSEQRNQYQLEGTKTLALNNTIPISRGIFGMAFRNSGIGLWNLAQTGIFFTDQNIISLEQEGSVTHITLENEQTISTDFYRIESLIAVDGVLVLNMETGQQLAFVGNDFEFVRRGGINGEGPNAEPVNIFRFDDEEIQSDLIDWQALDYANSEIRLIVDRDFRLYSTELSFNFFRRGNSLRPELDALGLNTNIYDITISNSDKPLTLAVEPDDISEIAINASQVQVIDLNEGELVESRDIVREVQVSNSRILFLHNDGGSSRLLLNQATIETASSIAVNQEALANQEGYQSRNYNNLGTHFFDYHPQFDMSHSYLPVNRVTGNFIYSVQDFIVPSHTLALEWSRTYNSQSPDDLTPSYMRDGDYLLANMGLGWRHSYQYDLDLNYVPLGEIHLILPDGSIHIFRRTESGVYRSRSLLSWTVEHVSSGNWRAYTTEGLIYHFDEVGRLQEISNIDGVSITFSAIPDQILANEGWTSGFYITETYGRRLEVFADEDGYIREVRDPQLRRIQYDYAGNGRLLTVHYVAYDEQADYSYGGGYLTAINDPHSPYHQNLEIGYDDDGRVLKYTANPQGDTRFHTDYVYDDGETRETQAVNGETRIWVWLYDEAYRLTEWNLKDTEWIYRLSYDADGRLATFRQPEGAILRYTFDEYGYLVRFSDPQFGAEDAYRLSYTSPDNSYLHLLSEVDSVQNDYLRLRYDENGRITSLTRPYGASGELDSTTNYSYDDFGRIETVYFAGQLTQYNYDNFGYVESIGDGTQTFWNARYDFVGRLLMLDDLRDDGKTSYVLWDDDHNRIDSLVVEDIRYEYAYDEWGNLTGYQLNGREDSFIYNGLNQMVSHTDSLKNLVEYNYDELGNLLQISDKNGERNFTYDAASFLATQQNGEDVPITLSTSPMINGTETIYRESRGDNTIAEYHYDGLGRIRRVMLFDLNGRQLIDYSLNYSPLGYLREINELYNPKGREIRISNDIQGHPVSSTIASDARMSYGYDEQGNLIRVTDPMGRILRYEYDTQGNLKGVIFADETAQDYSYTAQGQLVAFTDAEGKSYEYQYNSFGQVVEIIDSSGNHTLYSYDERGNLTVIEDARGYTSQYDYNEANQLIRYTDAEGNTIDYSYDGLGRLTSIIQPLGLETEIRYLNSGEIGVITQPDDREFLYGYNNSGQLTSITNPLGHTTLYAYDPHGLLGEIINPFGQKEAFVWRDNDRIIEYTSANGSEYLYVYDDIGRLETIRNQGDEINLLDTRMTYDDSGFVTQLSLESGSDSIEHDYVYNDMGRVISYTRPEGGEWQFSYDGLGRVTHATNPLGVVTHYLYEGNSLSLYHDYDAETESQPAEVFEYDSVGNLISYVALDGTTYSFSYDGNNRLIERTITAPDGETKTETYQYDALGRVSSITDSTGLRTNYGYDVFGNLTLQQFRAEDSDNRPAYRYIYDEENNLRGIQLPDGQNIAMTYNVLNQRVRYVDALNNSWSYSYDNAGNVTQISNPLGSLFSFEFDSVNRITQLTYPTGAEVVVSYDTAGMLSGITLPTTDTSDNTKNERVSYEFDHEGRLVNISHNEQPQIHFVRDALGNITQLQNADGKQIDFGYDAQGRLTLITPQSDTEPEILRTYDEMGRLVGIEREEQLTSFGYDAFGNVISMDSPDLTMAYEYEYNTEGHLIRRSGEFGTIDYVYDGFNRPIKVTVDGETVDISYNANGWRTNLTRSNGTSTSYAYDDNGRIRSVIHLSDGERLDGFIYEYDAAGNMVRMTRTDGRSVLYSYDSSQQLISERWLDPENELVYSATYSYDLAGNRTEQAIFSKEEGRQRTTFVYNHFNQLIEEIQGTDLPVDSSTIPIVGGLVLSLPLLWWLRRRRQFIPLLMIIPIAIPLFQQTTVTTMSIKYSYDANGNLMLVEEGETALSLEYDSFNRLIGLERSTITENPNDASVLSIMELRYDGMGRPAKFIRDGVEYAFFYDAFGLVAIKNLRDETEMRYLSPFEDEVWLREVDGDAQWALADGLGTIHGYLNPDGTLNDNNFNIRAFGEVGESDWPQLLFLGQLYVPQTQLYWMGARMYDPRLGRFIQRDPVRHDPQGNLYTYAYNHPTGAKDTSGFTPEAIFSGIVPDVPQIELADLIPQPTYPEIMQAPSVYEQQSAESHRILEVGYEARFTLNDTVFALGEGACDLYLYAYHPTPENYQDGAGDSFEAMLNLYDENTGWIPATHPEFGTKTDAIQHLEAALPMLAFAQNDFRTLTGCAEQLSLPQLPDPTSTIADKLARDAFADMLREVPLYPVLESELPNLQSVEHIVPQLQLPQVQVAVPHPMIIPPLSGQIGNLQTDSYNFFSEVLLPSVGD